MEQISIFDLLESATFVITYARLNGFRGQDEIKSSKERCIKDVGEWRKAHPDYLFIQFEEA